MPLPRIETPTYELTLPSSGQKIPYRPFLVKEEKILLIAMESEDETQIIKSIETIINNCLHDDKIKSEDMAMFDIEYVFLQLRSKSKGEVVDLNFDCEVCNNPIAFSINLNDVEVQRTEGHDCKIPLSDGIGVIMRYPNMNLKQILDKEQSEVENIFESLVYCLETIYDGDKVYSAKDQTQEELTEFFDSLPENEFAKIQEFFTTMPKLSHDIVLECKFKTGKGKNAKVCGHKMDRKLEGLQSFFG